MPNAAKYINTLNMYDTMRAISLVKIILQIKKKKYTREENPYHN